jgi:hypothetical protein
MHVRGIRGMCVVAVGNSREAVSSSVTSEADG